MKKYPLPNKETELNGKEIVRWHKHMFERHRTHTVHKITFIRMLSEASSESNAFQRRLFPIKTMKSHPSERNESETAHSVLISFKTNQYVMVDGCLFDLPNGKCHIP